MPYESPKHAIIKVGNICNNNCLGCLISCGEVKNFVLSTSEIKKELIKLKRAGFYNIEPVAGEFTIHKNFLDVLKLMSSMFSKIVLVSNGRMFADEEFVKSIINSIKNSSCNLDLEIAIHGHNSFIHDWFTNAPGSFVQTLTGIKNIIKYKSFFNNLAINTIVLKSNYKFLDKISEIISEFKSFNGWGVISFIPTEGKAFKNMEALMPKYKDLVIMNRIFTKISSNFKSIDFCGFPFCLFDNEMRNNTKGVHIINSTVIEAEKDKKIVRNVDPSFSFYAVNYISNISAYKKIRELRSANNSYRIKLSPCKNCIYTSKCLGVWKGYANLFGLKMVNKEIEYLTKINF